MIFSDAVTMAPSVNEGTASDLTSKYAITNTKIYTSTNTTHTDDSQRGMPLDNIVPMNIISAASPRRNYHPDRRMSTGLAVLKNIVVIETAPYMRINPKWKAKFRWDLVR